MGLFPRIGVSVDTLDVAAAERIGRYNLPRVLSFIEAIAPHAAIVIHSLDHPAYTPRIANWRSRPPADYRTIVNLIAGTTTKAGLTVKARLDRRTYRRGVKVIQMERGWQP